MIKLQEYLNETQQTVAILARALDVQHTVALRWANGTRIPSKENMQKIYEWSGGRVEPNDFYNINDIEKELNDGGSQTDYPSEG